MIPILIATLFGCGQTNAANSGKAGESIQTAAVATSAEKAEAPSIKVIEIQNFDGERGVPFEIEGINNAEAAGKIAGVILGQYQKEGLFKDYCLQLIEHDSGKGIWIVSFWADDKETIPGSDLEIALREDNAQIVGIWIGE